MEKTQAKVKYIGEIAVILCLEMIMLLFRMVQPISWPTTIPAVWQSVGNEFIFSCIELSLVIVIVAHFIFKNSFNELGLKSIKPSVASLVSNIGFIGVCVGVSFLTNQFSKISHFNGLEIALQIGMNFIMIATVKEIIFRGFLFQSLYKLMNGKGVAAGILSGILFALTYIPSILMDLSVVHMEVFLSALALPLVLGIYLGLIYHYERNLGVCILIQGTSLSLVTLKSDVFTNLLAGVYGVALFIYLIYKMIKYKKLNGEPVKECSDDYIQANREMEQLIEEKPSKEEEESIEEVHSKEEIQSIGKVQLVEEYCEPIPFIEESQSIQKHESPEELQEELSKELPEEERVQEIEQIDQESQAELVVPTETGVEEIEDLQAQVIGKQDLIEASEVEVEMEKPLKEVQGEVIDLEERKQKMAQVLEEEDLEITVIMPSITDEMLKGNYTRFEARGTKNEIQPEPNFIAHLEQALGEFEGVYRQVVPTEMPVDVLYFSGEKYDALVTNGMRAMVMSVPPVLEEYKQAELMMFIDKSFAPPEDGGKEDNGWLIKLITDLALYPKQMNTYLGWGHIVGNGEDLESYDTSVAYCGALVYPPMVQEQFAFYRYNEKDRNIFIYNVMPLFKEELKFIQEHSSDQFINLMSQMGISQVIYPNRSNVIKSMKR